MSAAVALLRPGHCVRSAAMFLRRLSRHSVETRLALGSAAGLALHYALSGLGDAATALGLGAVLAAAQTKVNISKGQAIGKDGGGCC